jgi:5-methylcytosine-specific restriction endonuclease McrA
VLNCAGIVLHAATRGGKLCPHFRNGNRDTGYEPNLTSGGRAKICSSNRAALEAYAQREWPGNNIRECAQCLGPDSPLAATSALHSDEMPANRHVLSDLEARKKPRQSDIRSSARIFRRDGWICHWCGRPVICAAAMKCLARFVREAGMAAPIAYYDLHWTRSNAPLLDHMGAVVDHIEPHSSGGQYEDTNLVTSCCKCNALKSAAKQDIFRASHPRRLIKGRYGEPPNTGMDFQRS